MTPNNLSINYKTLLNSKLKLTLKINSVNETFKVSQYLQLKTGVSPALFSNIVYQFFCWYDSSLTYIDMSPVI